VGIDISIPLVGNPWDPELEVITSDWWRENLRKKVTVGIVFLT
jgi:hypothetical protein